MDEYGALVARCARLAGIAPDFADAFGKTAVTSTATYVGLLDGFGFPTGTPDEARDSLRRLEALRHAVLEPLVVVEAGQPATVPLRGKLSSDAAWGLTHEDGTVSEQRLARGDTRALSLPPLPAGYHRLSLEADGARTDAYILAAPPRCWEPPELAGDKREWGLSVQVYGLRSRRNLGIGDFTDVAEMARGAGRAGASFVGLSPLHALFPADRQKYSPYSPSSRLFLEPLYIDVQAIEGFATSRAARLLDDPATALTIAEMKGEGLVDYARAWQVKRPILEALWREHGSEENAAFELFRHEQGEPLALHATFDALAQHFADQGSFWVGDWPLEYRQPTSEAVARFRRDNGERIAFYAWLQWLADDQLARAARRARSSGMHIGLYRDLAVGSDRGGSEVWAHLDAYAGSLSVGAPPDPLAPQGQNWGLPALDPVALARTGLAGFRAPIRANMRHAGAIRIDHAFQLRRLFLIPPGREASEGAYVDFPFEAMLAVLRIESHRARCLVIAEDLGTSPPNFSEAIMRSGIYGYRVVPFERDGDGSFRRGGRYDKRAMAVASTHDLPTLIGWWRGTDIDIRNSLGIFDLEAAAAMHTGRTQELRQFCDALAAEKLLPDGGEVPRDPPVEAATAFLARTNCALVCLQIEDAIGEINQANLPGIVEGHPNWRRRLSLDLDETFAPGSDLNRLAAVLAAEGRDLRRRVSTLSRPPPRATYRLQFHEGFTFDDAAAIVPYLARLGISHVYASPILMAQPGSTHGYDVADHARLNPELGGEDGFLRLSDALRAHGLGFVLDIVPNHMGIGSHSPAWLSMLEWGRESPSMIMFDVDWERRGAGGKIIVPSLGDRYGVVLERGELRLAFDPQRGSLDVWYFENRFPICPRNYPDVLETVLPGIGSGNDAARRALIGISEAFRALVHRKDDAVEAAEELKLALKTLVAGSAAVEAALTAATAVFNGSEEQPDSFSMLHRLLEKQAYRLAHWRVASSDINYRRFFDINTLAGLRAEDPAVFERTHELILRLVREGRIDGLRIDHVDGLADPEGYLRALQNAVGPAFYILVEKILEPGEKLRTWPIAGTSGYEVLNLLDSIFVDTHAAADFQHIYEREIGAAVDYGRDLRAAKDEILANSFSSELETLVGKLKIIADASPKTRDFSRNVLRRALSGLIAFFPVYRTYVTDDGAAAEDLELIEDTAAQLRKVRVRSDPAAIEFITDLLAMKAGPGDDTARSFRRLFQQLTGPVMAKSLEDTLFYRHARLIALNEVGGDPGEFGHSVAHFHAANRERARAWPHNMIATSTHDTKRGEDARSRLAALTEMPREWEGAVAAWNEATAEYRAANAPDANDCYVILQALIGAWPPELLDETTDGTQAFGERMVAYIVKALRESKRVSTWTDPDTRYEEGAAALIREALDPAGPFLAKIRPFVRRVAFLGMLNALSRTALKYTLPGVPDIYQGAEMWDFSLVDPDNRRPVDYAARAAVLEHPASPDALAAAWRSGALKLALTRRLLADRAQEPDVYAEAGYRPIEAAGTHRVRIVAFARERDGAAVVTVVARQVCALSADAETWPIGGVWADTTIRLPAGRWCDLVSGNEHEFASSTVAISELFSKLPLCVLRKVA